jgi:hypothetical protein
MPVRPSTITQDMGTPAIKKAAPKATVISTVWPTSGWISSRATEMA